MKMNGSLKRWLSLSILFVLMIASVLGCSSTSEKTSADGSKEVTIDFAIHVANPKDQEPAFYQMVQKFKEKYPNIKINLIGTDQKEHIKNIKMQAQSNTLPDIFWILPATAKELEEAGMLLDLSPFLNDKTVDPNKFQKSMINTYNLKGHQYGLPYQALVTGFWYNKALFDKYNLKLPETYEDLKAATKVFKENDVTTIAKGAKDPYSVWAFLTMFSRYGYFDKIDQILVGKEKFNNADFLKLYQKIDELAKLGAFPKNVQTLSYFQAVDMFLNGKAALLDAGVWETQKIQQSAIGKETGFWWGPTFSDGSGNQKLSSVVPAAPLVVSKKVKDDKAKYDAVKKFMGFYYSEEGAQIMLDNQVPPVIKYSGQIDKAANPVFAKVVEAMNDPAWESQPNQPDLIVSEAIGNAIYDSIYGVINGVYTPEEALKVVDKKISDQ